MEVIFSENAERAIKKAIKGSSTSLDDVRGQIQNRGNGTFTLQSLFQSQDDTKVKAEIVSGDSIYVSLIHERQAVREKCCICGKELEVLPNGRIAGNSPYPVKESGHCCNECVVKYVIPARYGRM